MARRCCYPILKSLIFRANIDGSLDYYRALLRTIQRERFIDEHILGISKEKFNAYIEELESAGYIKKVEPDAVEHPLHIA